MGDFFPSTKLTDPKDEQVTVKLMRFLETYIPRRNLLRKDVHKKQNIFRNILLELEHENVSLRYCNNEQKKMISTLEGRVCKLQNQIDGLLYKLNSACDVMRNMQQKLRDSERQLKERTMDQQKILQRCNARIQKETDRMSNESDIKLQEQHKRLTSYIRKKDDELRMVKQILSSTHESMSNTRTEITEELIPMTSKEEPAVSVDSQVPRSHRSQQSSPTGSRINLSDDVQGKIAKKAIPMASKEESSRIAEESIRTMCTDTPLCSTMIALAKIATNNRFKSDRKVKVVYLKRGNPSRTQRF